MQLINAPFVVTVSLKALSIVLQALLALDSLPDCPFTAPVDSCSPGCSTVTVGGLLFDHMSYNVQHGEPGILHRTHPEGAAGVRPRPETDSSVFGQGAQALIYSCHHHSTNSHLLVGFTVIIYQI